MEGKELHDEDDEMKSGSKKDQESESDDFGLPDASYDAESEEVEESSEESSFEYTPEEEESSAEPSAFGEFEDDSPSYRYTPEEEIKKTPTGLIVFLSLLGVIIIAILIYWFFFRTPREEPVAQPEMLDQMMEVEEDTSPEPVIEEPVEEPVDEPVFEEPITDVIEGSFETINTRTGRYYIVINSFFDEDLAADYAKNLGDLGINTLIIKPPDRKGFHRVAVSEDFGSWSAAENRLNELKPTYGEDIWVLKY